MTDGTNYPSINKDNASNAMQPSWAGKLIANPFVNEETAAARLNKNATLLKTFAEHSACESTTIYFLGDNACQVKLATIPKKDSKKEKDDNAPKSNDNIFNTLVALEKYINLATKVVKEGKNRLHF